MDENEVMESENENVVENETVEETVNENESQYNNIVGMLQNFASTIERMESEIKGMKQAQAVLIENGATIHEDGTATNTVEFRDVRDVRSLDLF